MFHRFALYLSKKEKVALPHYMVTPGPMSKQFQSDVGQTVWSEVFCC